jgi:hypothetical protein
MVLHVLAVLFTFWSVAFNAYVNYQQVDSLADAEYVQVGGYVFFNLYTRRWVGRAFCSCCH